MDNTRKFIKTVVVAGVMPAVTLAAVGCSTGQAASSADDCAANPRTVPVVQEGQPEPMYATLIAPGSPPAVATAAMGKVADGARGTGARVMISPIGASGSDSPIVFDQPVVPGAGANNDAVRARAVCTLRDEARAAAAPLIDAAAVPDVDAAGALAVTAARINAAPHGPVEVVIIGPIGELTDTAAIDCSAWSVTMVATTPVGATAGELADAKSQAQSFFQACGGGTVSYFDAAGLATFPPQVVTGDPVTPTGATSEPTSGPGPEVVPASFELNDKVAFAGNDATLLAAAFPVLDDVAAQLASHPTARATITGHAAALPPGSDRGGSPEQALALAQARADAVATYLTDRWGIVPARREAKSAGDTDPAQPGTSPEAVAANRRTTITIR